MIEQGLHIRSEHADRVARYCALHGVQIIDNVVIEGGPGVVGEPDDVANVVKFVKYLERERREEIKSRWSLRRYMKRTNAAIAEWSKNKPNFKMITGHMYIAENQNGFNNSLYDYFGATDDGEGNEYSKKRVREMVQNIPPSYPIGIVIIDQTFECGRLYLEFFNPDILKHKSR